MRQIVLDTETTGLEPKQGIVFHDKVGQRAQGEKVKDESGSLWEWLVPSAFIICAGWMIWHMPAYLLDFIPPGNASLFDQMSELHSRKDVTPDLGGLFGGFTDPIDWAAMMLIYSKRRSTRQTPVNIVGRTAGKISDSGSIQHRSGIRAST